MIIKSYNLIGELGTILKYKHTNFPNSKEHKITRYDSGTYQTKVTTINVEIIAKQIARP